MPKPPKSKAEKQFAATQKIADQALLEKETAQRERAEHMAGLKAQRLAKEANDKKIADAADALKAADKARKEAAKAKKAAAKVKSSSLAK